MKLWYYIASLGRGFPFPYCKVCGEMPSKMGNYTNMEILGIKNPWSFDRKYGLMCAHHAGELTEQLKKSMNLDDKTIKNAIGKAMSKTTDELPGLK